MYKRILSLCLVLLLLTGLWSGMTAAAAAEEELSIVTTIFPVYDWVREILGSHGQETQLTMLLDSGVDLHSFQPTVDDIVKISTCDLFIYVGGESDGWVDDALQESENPDMIVLNLLDILGDAAKEEEVVEGMESDHDHDHEDEEHEGEDHEHDSEDHEDEDHEHDGEDHEDEEVEYDEHVWLSLKNAGTLCGAIADALARLDPENAADYGDNLSAYREQLAALDDEYAQAAAAAQRDTVLFGDRFPFRYLTDDYGLKYYAAFSGCSAETEASFQTIVFLAGQVDALGLRTILQIESADGAIARTIRDNTASKDQEILTMDSMQATTAKDVADGVTYLSVMASNLDVLTQALQ